MIIIIIKKTKQNLKEIESDAADDYSSSKVNMAGHARLIVNNSTKKNKNNNNNINNKSNNKNCHMKKRIAFLAG
jgi:hypothetical protein